MAKIIKLKEVSKFLKPYTATLTGGAFDMIHIGHLRLLKKASQLGRPLVVIVQTDKVLKIRKGFNRPVIDELRRAEMIAGYEFVDFVLILDKPCHYEQYLKIIKPKVIVQGKENFQFRLNRKNIIEEKFPKTKVIFLPRQAKNTSTTSVINKISAKRDYSKIDDLIKKRLLYLSDHCPSNIGKISALLTKNGKIAAEAWNIDKEEMHAEMAVINKAKKKKIPLKSCKMYSLITPCLLCAKKIIKNKIPEFYYLYPFGNNDGLKLLRKNNIIVERYK